jgi:hypothetical protein
MNRMPRLAPVYFDRGTRCVVAVQPLSLRLSSLTTEPASVLAAGGGGAVAWAVAVGSRQRG